MRDGAAPGMLRGIDRAAFVVALGRRMHTAGVGAGLTATSTLARALAVHVPADRGELYWACRITLVRRSDEIAIFDRVFAAVFADAVLAMDPNARRRPLPLPSGPNDAYRGVPGPGGTDAPAPELPWATLPTVVAGTGDAGDDAPAMPLLLPTAAARLGDVPFDAFDPRDLDLLEAALRAVVDTWPRRRTRRTLTAAAGPRIGLRATIAASRHTGFEPVTPVMLRPRYRPRRVVMVCDVSASMRRHTTAYLHLMRALVRTTQTEVFAFATHLTRLTAALSRRSPIDAVAAATAAVDDRFGGTRIGSNLAELVGGPYRELVRGAVVLIGSDGWDADDADVLGRAMQRLRRRAHRVVWINPRAGQLRFAPTTAGMAAALPYCDRLLPGATLADLVRVLRVVCDETAEAPIRTLNSTA